MAQPLKCFFLFFLKVNCCEGKKVSDKDLGKYKTGLVNKIITQALNISRSSLQHQNLPRLRDNFRLTWLSTRRALAREVLALLVLAVDAPIIHVLHYSTQLLLKQSFKITYHMFWSNIGLKCKKDKPTKIWEYQIWLIAK